jgi:transposase
MVDWCGGAMKALNPLIEMLEKEVMSSPILHADDTPIRVLDRSQRNKGLGKGVKKGRIWAYVRDQRPWSGGAPPGAVYQFAPDWKEEHVLSHLGQSGGILQADGYKGYAKLYVPDLDGNSQFREAACWAHLRRDFHDVWTATKSGIAREALDRIGTLYDIEREITGHPADLRKAVRQEKSKPKVEAFHAWAERQLTRIPGKSDLAKAFRYALNRWTSFTLFLDDGRVAIDNNAAERALRPIGVGRRNWLFAGSDAGGETLARAMTIIETAKMNGLDPQAYLADVLDRIHDHMNPCLDELLPWNWTPRHVCTIDHVAEMLGEDLEMLEAIVENDDNLSYGAIISVHTGSDEGITALTDDGIDELKDMLHDARRSPDTWSAFLKDFVADLDVIARVKKNGPR